jgi:hypothetical protein
MSRSTSPPWPLALAALLTTLLAACQVVPAQGPSHAAGSAPTTIAAWTPPEGWLTSSRPDFEDLVLALFAAPPRPVAAATLDDLARTAGEPDAHEPALRAALLLASLDLEAADERLLELLEQRTPRPARPADSALVLAAARLGSSPFAEGLDLVPRLEALTLDGAPHPDLEVRVECARALLLLGSEQPVGLLLRVTRLGTPLGLERDGAWRDATTTTWSRNRAAEALAEHLGIACPYRGDAPLAEREAGALELERAARARLQPESPGLPSTVLDRAM